MRTFVETVVGGAIGLIALYVVGKVAFHAGRELGSAERAYQEIQKKSQDCEKKDAEEASDDASSDPPALSEENVSEPLIKKPSKLAIALGATKLFRRKDSVIGNLIKHPEAHKIEAFVDGDDLHIDVRKRPALA